jgi:protein-disulfide isomerase/uncharacterized membrane protein
MSERLKNILPAAVLAVIGLGVSFTIDHVHRRLVADVNYASFCNVNASVNCDVVLGSRYATLAGVSVSIWAILYYTIFLVFAAAIAYTGRAQTRERLTRGLLVWALWGLLFAGYMAVIAFFVLRTVCLMCSALYVVNIGLFVAAWLLRSYARRVGRRQAEQNAGRDRVVLAGSLTAGVLLLIIGSWEALGGGVRYGVAADIARDRPDFYRWYMAQPLVSAPSDDNHPRGSAKAPVTIVEFSDFECGHCANFHQSLEDVLPRLGQNVRVIFRHFPLDSSCNPKVTSALHPQACLAAVASECAADQGQFWQYQNLLFDNQQQLGRQFLIGYAAQLGLDVTRFTACLGSAEARQRVERDAKEGAALGIDSTPTVFINGRTIKGALDSQQLTDAVTLANVKPQ